MEGSKKNTFRKAIRHLKSTQIDEKLEFLSEIPTNNTTGIYVVEPEFQVQDPDIEGLPRAADFTQDALPDGRDTTGLFLEDGTILTIEPPGDTSYILGPMASMWYAWGNFSTIGYIRQSDRRMVDLGRITGQLGNWDGTSSFTSYGQLTLEQAVWFRDTPKLNGADSNTPNYRAFYPGPPSNHPDHFGRYLAVITGTAKPTKYTPPKRRVPPTMGGFDPSIPIGIANPFKGTGMGVAGLNAIASNPAFAAALYAALSVGAAWAMNLISQLGVSLSQAITVLQAYTGNEYEKQLEKDRTELDKSSKEYESKQSAKEKKEKEDAREKTKGIEKKLKQAQKDGNKEAEDYFERQYQNSVKQERAIRNKWREARKYQERSKKNSDSTTTWYGEQYVSKDKLLSESTKSILKNIKKPYVLPEEPKVKFKHKPKVNRTINADLMKKAEVPSSFKKAEERLWGKYEKDQNARMSQERKNEVLDHLGGSDHFWEYMTETSRKKSNDIIYTNFGEKPKKGKVIRKEELKGDALLFIADENGKKESILQSELSIRLADEFNKELFEKYFNEQETLEADKEPLFKKVSKRLKKEIDYSDKPAKKGYPNDPPPEMVNGWHPEYGKDKGYYNKLDPQSANAMPETGNPEIDKKVKAARKKPK